jgi:hypothetical protein
MNKLDHLVYFFREREKVRLDRELDENARSSDPTLRDYRFSNVSPWMDVVSQDNLRTVELVKPDIWKLAIVTSLRSASRQLAKLCKDCPPQDYGELKERVEQCLKKHRRATTIAFSRCGPPRRVILDVASAACSSELLIDIQQKNTVENAWQRFRSLPWMADNAFMAYLVARDLTGTELLHSPLDLDSWVYLGPGCKQGLERCGLPPTLEGLTIVRSRLAGKVPSCPYPDLHDCEHLVCEFLRWHRANFDDNPRMPRERLKAPAAPQQNGYTVELPLHPDPFSFSGLGSANKAIRE